MIDIDFFKPYNDAYGHQKGDDCLKTVAKRLEELLKRPGDLCARYGGEEFAVILPGTSAGGAYKVAEDLRAGIEALAIPHEKSNAKIVTISVGISSVSEPQEAAPESLIAAADEALYRAKQSGRNRICISGMDASMVASGLLA